MNRRLIVMLSLSAVGLLTVVGCQSSDPCSSRKPLLRRPLFPRLRGQCCDPAPAAPLVPAPAPIGGSPLPPLPPPVAPAPAANNYIPPPAPPAPSPPYNPAPSQYQPPAANYPAPAAIDSHSYRPIDPQPSWTPSTNYQNPNPAARLSTPEPATASPAPSRIQLQSPEPPRAPSTPSLQAPTAPSTPGLQAPTAPPPQLPVGIPNFAAAPNDGVTVGLKPLTDGLDWLEQNRYRSVLHVLGAGEADSADRKLVEKRGMHYLSVTLTPDSLARSVEDFNRIVDSKVLHPLFVYDRDGMLVGTLWYLHFRGKGDSDEVARGKAVPLGLRVNPTGEDRTLWLAVQKYLERRP